MKMGPRDARNEHALGCARQVGGNASAGSFGDAAWFREVVVLATLGVANESAIRLAGPAVEEVKPDPQGGGAPIDR
jgi:hypothetical protein